MENNLVSFAKNAAILGIFQLSQVQPAEAQWDTIEQIPSEDWKLAMAVIGFAGAAACFGYAGWTWIQSCRNRPVVANSPALSA